MNVFLKISVIKALAVITALTFVIGCNSKKDTKGSLLPKPIEKLYGNWLCSDLLDSVRARKSMKSIFYDLTLPYSYELQFDESFNDSVLVYNGFEQYFLPVTISNDSVILNNAIQGNPLAMIYDSVSTTLKMMIYRKYNYPLPSIFFKSDKKYIQPNGRFAEAFPSAFNEATVAGNYTLQTNNNSASGTSIAFSMNGDLEGYDGGLHYTCCIGGDCLGMMEKPMNTLNIIMEDKPSENWGWELSNNSDTLTLVKVKAANPDEPGTYRATPVILKLVRDK